MSFQRRVRVPGTSGAFHEAGVQRRYAGRHFAKMATRTTRAGPESAARSRSAAPARPRRGNGAVAERSSLFVNSVEKAMVVLKAFDASRPRLTLSQIAALSDMDLSGAQRFTYTLVTLGY